MKYFRYLNYVIRHRWYVFLECRKLGIIRLGLVHDWSKFRPSEFIPYARHFYGKGKAGISEGRDKTGYYKPTDTGDPDFDFAWLLHQKRNRHHWQSWILPTSRKGTKLLPVPKKYVMEMLADWIGASKAQGHGGDISRWWFENRDKVQIDPHAYTWLDMAVRARKEMR
ncbi:hypothetical protein KAR91_62035 [Candidatus Pacearchaeota archaeon]|nr:hypothetical protein [Candidatus Pacearchaeota archaeon]